MGRFKDLQVLSLMRTSPFLLYSTIQWMNYHLNKRKMTAVMVNNRKLMGLLRTKLEENGIDSWNRTYVLHWSLCCGGSICCGNEGQLSDPSWFGGNTCVWAGTGGTQEQPHNHGWKAESKFIFVTWPTGGSLKQHLGRGMQARGEHRHCGAWSVLEDQQTCWFCLCFRDLHRLILPPCFDLSHSRACLISLFWVYHRPVLLKHRFSTCPTHQAKQQLVWCMYFSTPQLQVTWTCLFMILLMLISLKNKWDTCMTLLKQKSMKGSSTWNFWASRRFKKVLLHAAAHQSNILDCLVVL